MCTIIRDCNDAFLFFKDLQVVKLRLIPEGLGPRNSFLLIAI